MGKARSARKKLIKIRRLHLRMPQSPNGGVRHVIGKDKENIGLSCRNKRQNKGKNKRREFHKKAILPS